MSNLEEYYERQKREYKPNKIFSGTKGIFAVAVICFFGCWVLLFVGLSFSNPYRFSLPYNAIDFQKIAYIDNQFVMYGVDFNAKYAKQLVIFTSLDGKKWDKAVIAKVKPETKSDADSYYSISNLGTIAYFNHQCMLIGAVPKILVSPDCHNWSYLETKQDNGNSTPFWNAGSSVVANDSLYVGTNRSGVYQSKDGITWHKESLPYPQESEQRNFENSFLSMAAGNNKLITSTNWMHNGKNVGLIYTKDLTTNEWSYEVYPTSVGNITRGKDRFVAMTGDSALVLVDGDSEWGRNENVSWNGETEVREPSELVFGLNNKFVSINLVNISDNGYDWSAINLRKSDLYGTTKIACSIYTCVSVDDNYQIIISNNGTDWELVDFKYKNPKPRWWRRFI